MLDEQSDQDEHDNDIGDDTEQDDDKMTSEEDDDDQNQSQSKNKDKSKKKKPGVKSEEIEKLLPAGTKPPKTKHDEPGPLDHLIEFILGDRFPTSEEYIRWLESEDMRENQPDIYMEFNSSK